MKKFLSLIAAVMMCMAMLSACSSDNDVDEGKSLKPSQNQSESASDGQTASEETSTETKYGDAEVYTNDKGKDVAKTESGVEVELTTDNLAKLYGEYQEVAGTGSDKEKELLDQIQLILEASQSVLEVQE